MAKRMIRLLVWSHDEAFYVFHLFVEDKYLAGHLEDSNVQDEK